MIDIIMFYITCSALNIVLACNITKHPDKPQYKSLGKAILIMTLSGPVGLIHTLYIVAKALWNKHS